MIAHCNRCSIEADFHSFCVARSSFQTIVGNHIYILYISVYTLVAALHLSDLSAIWIHLVSISMPYF